MGKIGKEMNLGDMGRIRFRGTFDFAKLVSSITGWYESLKYKNSIEKFSHKEKGGSAKVQLKFYGHKKPSEWAKNQVRVFIEIRDFKDVEVIRNGQKETLQSGFMVIELSGSLEMDPYKRFRNAGWLEKIRDFINDYILFQDIEQSWAQDHFAEIMSLHRLIKEVLEFETPTSEWEPGHE